MKDISGQIKAKIRERIKPHFDEVKPFAGNYRNLDDLRTILKSLFPQEPRLNKVEGTVWLLTRLFSKEEIFVIRNFENKETKGIMTVYKFLKTSDDSQRHSIKSEDRNGNQYVKKFTNGNSDHVISDSGSESWSETKSGVNERIRRNPKSALNEFAHIPDLDLFFETIAQMAKEEAWAYESQSGRFRYSILESYFNIVIQRLKYERDELKKCNKIIVRPSRFTNKDGKVITTEKCIINTGLLSRRGGFIYVIFDKNRKPNAQEWILQEDKDRVIRNIIDDKMSQRYLPFKNDIPERPDFHAELSRSKLIFIHGIEAVNNDHILIDHCERLPIGFLKRYFGEYFIRNHVPKTKEEWDEFKLYIKSQSYKYKDALAKLLNCIEEAQRAAQIDDTAKVNIYRQSKHSVGFFLPLYLEEPKDEMDFEVGVIIDMEKGDYVASTIYRTSMAYERIRVMGNHKRSWLDPRRIKYWKNPYLSNQEEENNSKSIIK